MLESLINWRFALKSLLWGGTMLGVLQLRHLSGSWSHALCGPWGCGPTLESVFTCHTAWIVLLTPVVVLIARQLSPAAVRVCGGIACGAGLLGLAGVAVWIAGTWYPAASGLEQTYIVQKYLYTVVCLVDLPMLQLLLAGSVLGYLGRVNFVRDKLQEPEDM